MQYVQEPKEKYLNIFTTFKIWSHKFNQIVPTEIPNSIYH